MSSFTSNNKSQYIHQKIDNLKNAKIEYLNSDFKQYFLSFKIIVIGNPGVGKSCVTFKAIQNQFKEGKNSTIGFDLLTYCLKLNDIPIQLQIWDTCGQEMYKSLIYNFFRNTSLAILVYAINDEESFNNLDYWLRELKNQSSPDIKLILLGNKTDLTEERKVSYKQGDLFSEENEFQLFLETSAKTGDNVNLVFTEAARILYNNYVDYSQCSRNTSLSSFQDISKITYESKRLKKIVPQPTQQVQSKHCCN